MVLLSLLKALSSNVQVTGSSVG